MYITESQLRKIQHAYMRGLCTQEYMESAVLKYWLHFKHTYNVNPFKLRVLGGGEIHVG